MRGGRVQQAQWRVICEEDRGRGKGSEALVLCRPRSSLQPGLDSSCTPSLTLAMLGGNLPLKASSFCRDLTRQERRWEKVMKLYLPW